jgi:hypothetical protein
MDGDERPASQNPPPGERGAGPGGGGDRTRTWLWLVEVSWLCGLSVCARGCGPPQRGGVGSSLCGFWLKNLLMLWIGEARGPSAPLSRRLFFLTGGRSGSSGRGRFRLRALLRLSMPCFSSSRSARSFHMAMIIASKKAFASAQGVSPSTGPPRRKTLLASSSVSRRKVWKHDVSHSQEACTFFIAPCRMSW